MHGCVPLCMHARGRVVGCGSRARRTAAAVQSWLLSSGNDGRVSVFDTTRTAATADGLPPQLVMQHIGHIGNIMDAQWSPHEDFMAMSVSNDGETYKEGGALQLWRMSWLLTSDFETAEKELRAHQKWLVRPPSATASNMRPLVQ